MTAKQMQQKIAELERRIAVLEQTRPLIVAPQPYYVPQPLPYVQPPLRYPYPWWTAQSTPVAASNNLPPTMTTTAYLVAKGVQSCQ